jgi:hypothetical protein
VGLDVHKDSISVAAAELGRAPARLIGKVTHDLNNTGSPPRRSCVRRKRCPPAAVDIAAPHSTR